MLSKAFSATFRLMSETPSAFTQTACVRAAIINISALMNKWKYSTVSRKCCTHCFRLSSRTRSSVPLVSSFTDFLISCSIFSLLIDNLEHSHYQHERLATVVVALFLIEVLVDHLMDFNVSKSFVTQQTLVNSALVTSVLGPGSTSSSATMFAVFLHCTLLC